MLRALWSSLLLPLLAVGSGLNAPQPEVAFSRTPDYQRTADQDDRSQLFDGATVLGTMWLSKAAVGWVAGARPIEIAIKLARPATIDGVCIHGARNSAAQVSFADRIDMFTSANGAGLQWGGEIRPASAGDGAYLAKWFCLDVSRRRVDGLRLVVMARGEYFFIDEIRLVPSQTRAAPIDPEIRPLASDRTANFVRRRKALERSLVDGLADLQQLEGASSQADSLNALVGSMQRGVSGRSFEELDDIERAAGLAIARRSGSKSDTLAVERSQPFGTIGYFNAPRAVDRPIQLMSGTHRVAAFNLHNLSAETVSVRVRLALDGATDQLRARPLVTGYVLADEGVLVGDPLLPLSNDQITIPPGQIRQLSIDLAASERACGIAVVHVQLVGPGIETRRIDLVVEQYAIRLNALPHTTVWGYLGDRPIVRFPAQAAADMQDHGVTTAVVPRGSLPWPLGRGLATLPYRSLDADLDSLPNFQHYLFYMGLEPGTLPLFGGQDQAYSSRWESRFRTWLSDWVDHLHARGLTNADFAFYPVDEPGNAAAVQTIVDLSRFVKKVDRSLQIFTTLRDPALLSDAFIGAVDIFDLSGPALTPGTIARLHRAGKQVVAYAAEGGGKSADPASFYRRQGWQAFALGLSGFGFWSYSDAGTDGTVWDDTDGVRKDPAVIYDVASGLVSSRRWEAWREGLQDFRLLDTAMAAAKSPAERSAVQLLALRGMNAARDETRIDDVRRILISKLPAAKCPSSQEP